MPDQRQPTTHFGEPGEHDGIFVFGSPRGGTSLVAGLLRLMGVDMGEANRGNNEDDSIIGARNPAELFDPQKGPAANGRIREAVLARRERADGPWGWKDPHGALYVPNVPAYLPRVHCIVVYRDPLAVSQSMTRRGGREPLEGVLDALMLYANATRFIEQGTVPCLAVSYEGGVRRPRALVRGLARFCGLDVDVEGVAGYVRPEGGYVSVEDYGRELAGGSG